MKKFCWEGKRRVLGMKNKGFILLKIGGLILLKLVGLHPTQVSRASPYSNGLRPFRAGAKWQSPIIHFLLGEFLSWNSDFLFFFVKNISRFKKTGLTLS